MSTTTRKRPSKEGFRAGRPTVGWTRGKQITASDQVKPGDVLIAVSYQFQAVNLVRVVDREGKLLPHGFDFEFIDNRTGQRSDGYAMFCHDHELTGKWYAYYRARKSGCEFCRKNRPKGKTYTCPYCRIVWNPAKSA